ncbi:Tat pathway signal sequence domain protein [Streptomyces sp. Go40/10]|uniref:Tat pathway signal sequence domain protein n=1 Tax=Streptomyces sp. Go40/10 TaxID=2825844 RepID=UPI001E406621|nr:Tat pathway signal sequence domain protein [Streptomyces sp. Go40/10]UFR05096.1 Tat pathway signal sequence domain protein [Streptomyces sp. Go40/10]
MSGIGPPEPGEGTRAWESRREEDTPAPLAARYARRRRIAAALAAAAVLLSGGGYLYATRPQQPTAHARRPHPQVPYPAQVVDLTYLDARPAPAGAPPHSFSFAVLVSVASGPPVTVTRVIQPYAGLSVTTDPPAPFRIRVDSARKITITMHVTECGKAPRNAGLPFLDVTLRNTRAIQEQSFIPGPHYAQDLSHALEVACSNRNR